MMLIGLGPTASCCLKCSSMYEYGMLLAGSVAHAALRHGAEATALVIQHIWQGISSRFARGA
jgi:uncharacterized protein (DUF58 family)